jgi:hypothetical protein
VIAAEHLQHDTPFGDLQLQRPTDRLAHLRFLLVVGGPGGGSSEEDTDPYR